MKLIGRPRRRFTISLVLVLALATVAWFALLSSALDRAWWPSLVRVAERWSERVLPPRIGAPSTVRTHCPRPIDVGALRRTVAAIDRVEVALSQRFDRAHTEALWTAAAEQPDATIATWSPPYPTLPISSKFAIVAVVIDDRSRGIVTVRFAPPLPKTGGSVLTFATHDDEPVCPRA